MKILHIISGVNPKNGGPIQGIRNYQNDLVHLGIERHIVTFEELKEIELWGFQDSFQFHALGKPRTSWHYNAALIPFLKKEAPNFDIIILNGLWSYQSYAALKAIIWLKKIEPNKKIPKLFVMPHGMLDPWFQKDKSRRWKALRNYFYWHLIEKKVINTADGILFTCEEEMLLARTTFSGYCPKKEINIGYGIQAPPPLSELMKSDFHIKYSLESKEPYLLFLSRIHPKKGLDLLLNAYSEVLNNSEFANKVPNLVIAGPGIETRYGKKLLDYLDKNPKVNAKVFLLGHLLGDIKWAAIYGCEAFILPSHQENFGIAVADALACYKPVLITTKVNIYREIEQGGGGLISEDNLVGTIENLKKWMDLSNEAKLKMGQDAFLVYKKHFGVKNAAIRLIEAIK